MEQVVAHRLQVGEPAPDIDVINAHGERLKTSALWTRKRTILSFLRHFG
jgi:hypothetical protein